MKGEVGGGAPQLSEDVCTMYDARNLMVWEWRANAQFKWIG